MCRSFFSYKLEFDGVFILVNPDCSVSLRDKVDESALQRVQSPTGVFSLAGKDTKRAPKGGPP